jgi:uncharacterized membrane protein YcaP (DUF421 family)
MWSFHVLGVPILQIAIRCVVVYVVVFGGLRLMGKREMGQLAPFDLVLILLIANAVQNAMVGSDTTLLGGVVAALTLLLLNALLGVLAARNRPLRRALIGKPSVLARDGLMNEAIMKREGVAKEELDAAIHEHGVRDLSEVELAILEIDGDISIVPKDSDTVHRSHRKVRQVKHGL